MFKSIEERNNMFTAKVIDRKTNQSTLYLCRACVYVNFDIQLQCKPKDKNYLPFLWVEFDHNKYKVEIIYG